MPGRPSAGLLVTLLGANGSGKSTLVRATVGLVPLTSGEVRLFGTPLREFRTWSRIGYVPQLETIDWNFPITVEEVIGMGFFTGFYIVPMFTLLQHRAPKEKKGDMIATSNFINVIGAIMASVLFWSLVALAGVAGIIQAVGPVEVAHGILTEIETSKERVLSFTVLEDTGKEFQRQYVTTTTRGGRVVEKTVVLRCQLREHLHAAMPGYAELFCHLWESPAAMIIARALPRDRQSPPATPAAASPTPTRDPEDR